MSNDPKQVAIALADAVASRRVSKDDVNKAAERLAEINPAIRRIEICKYGICIDYLMKPAELRKNVTDMWNSPAGLVRNLEIFPYGIVEPDLFNVRAALEMDELVGR